MADPLPATAPAPTPPGASSAWYAPTVRDQYRIGSDLVVTVREDDDGFVYETRTPPLSAETRHGKERVEEYLADVDVDRPRTREGTVERMETGLAPPYRGVVDRFTDTSAAGARRLRYHLTAAVQGLGVLTPMALDDRVRIADASDDRVVVHTRDFAPARTAVPADHPDLDRFMSERLARYTVTALEYEVPVTVYRERVLGDDVFETKYHVHEPTTLPGDDEIVASIQRTLVEESVAERVDDHVAYVRDRARTLLKRRLLAGSTRTALEAARNGLRRAFAVLGIRSPPPDRTVANRVDDLVYHVLRDVVAEDRLTIPIRDPNVERIEANRVGERVKVVPRPDAFEDDGRMPTTTRFERERRFVTLARRLGAAGGVELGPRTPHASVSIEPTPGAPVSCSVALPSASTDGPYVSIDKRRLEPTTAMDVLETEQIDPELLSLLWLAVEHHQSIAFVGPERARPASLVEAVAPFVPFEDRPVTIADRTRTIRLPHETGVSLSTEALEGTEAETSPLERVTDLRPDVTIMTDIESEAAYRQFATALSNGQGTLVSANTDGITGFAHRAVGQGVPLFTLQSIDLLVEMRTDGQSPSVPEVVMPTCEGDGSRTLVDGSECELRAVSLNGADGTPSRFDPYIEALADTTGQSIEDLTAAHRRRTRYVRYLETSDIRDPEDLFAFLADLRTDEAATVERIHRVISE